VAASNQILAGHSFTAAAAGPCLAGDMHKWHPHFAEQVWSVNESVNKLIDPSEPARFVDLHFRGNCRPFHSFRFSDGLPIW
jgi:hypothetical protein